MNLSKIMFSVIFTLFCTLTPAFADRPNFEVSLYTGITGLVKLGDSLVQVEKSVKYKAEKTSPITDPELVKLHFTESLYYNEIGMRLYFRRTGLVLIMVQEPFRGTIRTKKIDLFSFSVPPVSDWDSLLTREFGQPEFRATGGLLNSEGMFFTWGDISFNRMGPNQLALYRDAEIMKYRENNFGRQVELYPSNK